MIQLSYTAWKLQHNSLNLWIQLHNQGGELIVGAIENYIREIMIHPLITLLCSELRSISTVCFIWALLFFPFKEGTAWPCKHRTKRKSQMLAREVGSRIGSTTHLVPAQKKLCRSKDLINHPEWELKQESLLSNSYKSMMNLKRKKKKERNETVKVWSSGQIGFEWIFLVSLLCAVVQWSDLIGVTFNLSLGSHC